MLLEVSIGYLIALVWFVFNLFKFSGNETELKETNKDSICKLNDNKGMYWSSS